MTGTSDGNESFMNTALHSTVAMKKHTHHMIQLITIENILVYLRAA